MPMREECRHYKSRTYASGEVARWCAKDFAPEAPWRCPVDCAGYERRGGDAGFTVGSLAPRPSPPDPETPDAAALLDQAEDIVNLVGPDVLADWEKERLRRQAEDQPFWRKLLRRPRRPRRR